jgi:hypothetical protein
MLVTEDQFRRKYGAFISMDGEPAIEIGVDDEYTDEQFYADIEKNKDKLNALIAKGIEEDTNGKTLDMDKLCKAQRLLNKLLSSKEGQRVLLDAFHN